MNDLVRPEDIFKWSLRKMLHRHKPMITREYRHPEIRGLFVQTRKCRTCGKPMKEKISADRA